MKDTILFWEFHGIKAFICKYKEIYLTFNVCCNYHTMHPNTLEIIQRNKHLHEICKLDYKDLITQM